MYLIFKTVISAIIIVIVSEIAKKSSFLAAIIVSIPLTSLLAFIWLYWDTKDNQKIIDLSNSTLLMVIPSLSFFIILPILIKLNLSFALSMGASVIFTAICYWFFFILLNKIGVLGF